MKLKEAVVAYFIAHYLYVWSMGLCYLTALSVETVYVELQD
jgi:hypothetical protein